ncbi:ganglioside GM2 activator-like [Liolophura sinensis]|uniref:ganglioside GM2 activator-like n=1 Tax=Liolophura sinensis TaxID=3198878 RepID=UPI003158D63E
MLRFLVLSLTLSYTLAVSDTFKWKDCTTAANRALAVSNIKVSPLPLTVPGPLTLSFDASLSKPLNNVNLILEVEKNLGFFGYVKVPCLNEIGSCTYDGCEKATELGNYLKVTDNSIFKQIYTMLKNNHINLFGCPVPSPQTGSVKAFNYTIPNPGKQFDWLVNGDYHIIARIQDKVSKVDYACLDLNIGVMRKA